MTNILPIINNVWQINSTCKETARKTFKYKYTFSSNITITIVFWGSNIAESHDLSFLIADKQDLPQVSRERLKIISTELLCGIVNKNRQLGKYTWMYLILRPRQIWDHLHITQIWGISDLGGRQTVKRTEGKVIEDKTQSACKDVCQFLETIKSSKSSCFMSNSIGVLHSGKKETMLASCPR
jgi:hypothetical protein